MVTASVSSFSTKVAGQRNSAWICSGRARGPMFPSQPWIKTTCSISLPLRITRWETPQGRRITSSVARSNTRTWFARWGMGSKRMKTKIFSLKLLPSGDVVFDREEDNCIRLVKRRGTVAECLADTRYNDEVYIGIDLIEISPDGRWMAFRRSKLPPPGDRYYGYQYDLFVKEI